MVETNDRTDTSRNSRYISPVTSQLDCFNSNTSRELATMELRVSDEETETPNIQQQMNAQISTLEPSYSLDQKPVSLQPPPFVQSQSYYRNAVHFAPSYIPTKPNYSYPPYQSSLNGTSTIPESALSYAQPPIHFPPTRSQVSYPHYVNVSNLPHSINKQSLVQLIDSIIETNFEYPEIAAYSIVKFVEDSRESDTSDSSSAENDDDFGFSSYCVIEVSDWNFALKLIENMNGYVWLQKILDARFQNGYYNSYLGIQNKMKNSNLDTGSYSNSPSPSSENLSKTPGVSYSDPLTSHNSPSVTTSIQGDPNIPSGYTNNYESHPFYNYHHIQQIPGVSPQYVGPPQPPNYMNPAMPPSGRFLQRRHSSNRSFGQKKSLSRNSSDSTFSSNKNSFSSSSSLSSTVANSANTKQPVPPFIMNMVSQKTNSPPPVETSDRSEDNDFINSKTENAEEPIKVNPCRLFIGNVPYSSTWMSLKNFFVQRSKIMRPELNMSILRVEIPMHSPGQGSTFGNGMERINMISESPKSTALGVPQIQPISKSRGFAIVTTGNAESADALIALFDNEEFEGRSITVRYDKFPEFNNYVLQQLYNSNNVDKYGSDSNIYHGSSVINYLAFERNLFQQKFYYGSGLQNPIQHQQHGMHPPPQQLIYPYYGMQPPPMQAPAPILRQGSNPNIQTTQYYPMQPNYQRLYSEKQPQSYGGPELLEKSKANSGQKNPIQIKSDFDKLEEPLPYDAPCKPSKLANNTEEESRFKMTQKQLNDEEKARELVNSFGDLGIK